jgi:drug/metabolite transporter (DMT)-like permease
MRQFAKQYLQWILLFLLMIIWGSSFLLMKRSLEYFTAVELGTLRMVFASAAMVPLALWHGLKKIKPSQWFFLTLFALFGNLIPAYLFSIAQTKIDSSLAGILNAMTPVFTLIIGFIIFKLRVRFINIIGLIMGLVGAIAIIYNSGSGNMTVHFGYAGLIVVATMFYATNINIIKFKLSDIEPIKIAIYGLSLLFIPLTSFLFIGTDIINTVQQPGAAFALIFPATLGFICSAAAIMLFNTLIKITTPIFASSVTYLIPIVAMLIGFFDGEKLTIISVFWVGIIITGVLLVNKKSRKAQL